ncbi:MAG: DUF3179 domain-containing protein [Gemmatimonadetes bacterium]|nr:DUF3179 domain-containing protein [Gemmatimonadota bacterium]
MRASSWIGSALAVGLLGSMAQGQSADETIHVVLPCDAIPAIDAPRFEPVRTARLLADDELVIGLVGENDARAYSTWELDQHEIVNDVFEGRPVAVTW